MKGPPKKYPDDWVAKPCTRCLKPKERSEYYTIRYKDGVRYAGRCKECERELMRYSANRSATKKDRLVAVRNAARTRAFIKIDKLIEVCYLLAEHKVTDAQELLKQIKPRVVQRKKKA